MFHNNYEDLKRYCAERGYGATPTSIQIIVTLLTSPSFWAISHHRFGLWVNSIKTSYRNPIKLGLKIIYFLGKYLVVCFTKIEILSTAEIGDGFYLSNKGNIIIGAHSFGRGCSVHYNVTVGQGASAEEVPVIGDHVSIGHDSLVFGNITVGDNVTIGNNTVLSRKIPSGIEIQGNPCKIVKRDKIVGSNV